MTRADLLKAEIQAELNTKGRKSPDDLLELILRGAVHDALCELVFFSPPNALQTSLTALQAGIRRAAAGAEPAARLSLLSFQAQLAIWLISFLPRWNLRDSGRHGSAALSQAEVADLADEAQALAIELSQRDAGSASVLLANSRVEAMSRLKAEANPDPAGAAASWVGTSLADCLHSHRDAFDRSHLRRIAEMRADGKTASEISNDYAAFLPYAMYLGASFVTCNPPLVDLAWQADPPRWNAVADAIIADHPLGDGDELARRLTLEVVLSNMQLLRPIFLLSLGEMGCVSLQVNPKKHDDAAEMVADAKSIYTELREQLNGGVPNVVFKLPGTKAGLQACRALTADGIGVNITVNFSLFQHLPFAEAILQGEAIFCVLAHMSGRLAFPVRDELLGKLAELSSLGIDEAGARLAAAWSGIAVLKRVHHLLAARGAFSRLRLLIASMRIYSGAAYQGLPSPIPDISEAVGAGILTVFPNVRSAFDTLASIALDPCRIEAPIPPGVLEVLGQSEIFRQAYYLDDPAWVEDGPALRPEKVLALADEAGTAAWPPVHNTLTEFCKAYDVFVARIEGRRRLGLLRHRAMAPGEWSEAEAGMLAEALCQFDPSSVADALRLLAEIAPDGRIGNCLRRNQVGQAIRSQDQGFLLTLLEEALARHPC